MKNVQWAMSQWVFSIPSNTEKAPQQGERGNSLLNFNNPEIPKYCTILYPPVHSLALSLTNAVSRQHRRKIFFSCLAEVNLFLILITNFDDEPEEHQQDSLEEKPSCLLFARYCLCVDCIADWLASWSLNLH